MKQSANVRSTDRDHREGEKAQETPKFVAFFSSRLLWSTLIASVPCAHLEAHLSTRDSNLGGFRSLVPTRVRVRRRAFRLFAERPGVRRLKRVWKCRWEQRRFPRRSNGTERHGLGAGGRRAEDQAPPARGRGQDGGPAREYDAHGGLRGAAQARSGLVRGGVRRHAKARPDEATHVRDQASRARAEAVRAGGGHRRVPRAVQDGQQVRGEVLRELHHEGLEAVHRHGVRAQGTVPTRSTRRTTGASLGNTKNHFSPGGGFRF